jgi:hypothetical protein
MKNSQRRIPSVETLQLISELHQAGLKSVAEVETAIRGMRHIYEATREIRRLRHMIECPSSDRPQLQEIEAAIREVKRIGVATRREGHHE